MKKTMAKFFIMTTALMIFLAGCNNLLGNNIKDDGTNDIAGNSSKTVTLKGSLAVEGDAAPSEILAMVAGADLRSAVTSGSMHDGYSFELKATVKNSRDSVDAEVDGDQFSITLEEDKDYEFDLTLFSSTVCPTLTISKIMFGDTEANPDNVNLNGLSSEELANTKVYFSPDTSLSGTGKIALEIKTSVPDKVKYVGYSFVKSDNAAYSGSGTEEFDADSKATINVTEGALKGKDPTPIPNGIYDFEFRFYNEDPTAIVAAAPTPLAVAYQKINVFAGFVTDTWISDGSAYFEADAGNHGDFTVTLSAIEAYKNPKEFYVNGGGTNGSWGYADDYNAGTSIRRPFQTLQQAIDTVIEKNDATSEYTIYVKDTVYPKQIMTDKDGTVLPAAVYKMADFSELETTALNLKIVGLGNDATLNGTDSNGNTCGSVINAATGFTSNKQESALNLTLKNLKITGGEQGGVYIDKGRGENAATVTIENCTIFENNASSGGGIYNDGGTVTITNSTITGNTAGSGGGIYNTGGTVTVTGGQISNNTATSSGGGGIYNVGYGSEVVLNNVSVTENKAYDSTNNVPSDGNGIYNFGGTVTLNGGCVTGNRYAITGDADSHDSIYLAGGTLNISDTVTFDDAITAAQNSSPTNIIATKEGSEIKFALTNQDAKMIVVAAGGTLNLNGNPDDGANEYKLIVDANNPEYSPSGNRTTIISLSEAYSPLAGEKVPGGILNAYNSVLKNNYNDSDAGAVIVATGANASFNSCEIYDCSSAEGGSIFVYSEATLKLIDTQIAEAKDSNVDYDVYISGGSCDSFIEFGGKVCKYGTTGGALEINLDGQSLTYNANGVDTPYTPIIINNALTDGSKINMQIPANTTIGPVAQGNAVAIKSSCGYFDFVYNDDEYFALDENGYLKSITFTKNAFIQYCAANRSTLTFDDSMPSGTSDENVYKYVKSITIPEGYKVIASGWGYGKVNNYYISYIFCDSRNTLETVILPESLERIGSYAFAGCTKIASMTIPESVTTIESNVFSWCSALTSVTLKEGVTSIDSSAFQYCENLASLTIPDSVTEIGDGAFSGCEKLESITIPEKVTAIVDNTFGGCTSLKSITILGSVTTIGERAFEGCTSLTSVTIPDSVTTIGENAFDGCSSLPSITIPKGVTEIGQYAFNSCEKLESVTIPDSVTTIGMCAFSGCEKLASVTFPKSVTEIGSDAFAGCTKLTTVYMESQTPPELGSDAFPDNVKTICVPSEAARQAYISATDWDAYKNIIYVPFTKAILESDLESKGETIDSVEYYTMPSGYGMIMPNTFEGCTNLKGVVISRDVVRIEADAFKNCAELVSVTLKRYEPNSPDTIITTIVSTKDDTSKPNSFNGCTKLASIYVPDDPSGAAGPGTLKTDYSRGWSDTNYSVMLKSSTLSPVTFGEISKNLDKNVTTSIEIPFGYTVINTYDDDDENSVFSVYSKLETITLPESVTEISSFAFKECTVSSLTIKAQTPPTLGEYLPLTPTRRNTPVIVAILVPENAVETYQNECDNASSTWYNKASVSQIYAIGETPAISIKTKANSIRIGVDKPFELTDIITIEPSNYTKNKLKITVKDANNGEYPNAVDGTKIQNLTEGAKGTITVTLGHHSPIDISFVCYASEVFDADALNSIQGPNTETLTIPYGFTSIEGTDQKPVFANYSSLQTITIPETVTLMNAYMGFGSTVVRQINMNGLPPSIENGTFNGFNSVSSTDHTNLMVLPAYRTEYEQWHSVNNLSDKVKLVFE